MLSPGVYWLGVNSDASVEVFHEDIEVFTPLPTTFPTAPNHGTLVDLALALFLQGTK
jgi:hypothetical protein